MLASCEAVELRVEAPFQTRPAMRTESFFRRRKANENRPSSVAATIETAWPLLSIVGPLRHTHKTRALSTDGCEFGTARPSSVCEIRS
jgi:hypothetical protein